MRQVENYEQDSPPLHGLDSTVADGFGGGGKQRRSTERLDSNGKRQEFPSFFSSADMWLTDDRGVYRQGKYI